MKRLTRLLSLLSLLADLSLVLLLGPMKKVDRMYSLKMILLSIFDGLIESRKIMTGIADV
jgi:hypothetical protein